MTFSGNASNLYQCKYVVGGVGWVVATAREKKPNNMNDRVWSGHDIHKYPIFH